ncbi:hypothetical protein [Burkholderia gladioli]|uniref:hypothetical protein n=1 Tax=Burkholderia gladioli TaxID=28095 RepID=UPI0019D0657E|nr:hypothetical protein [Burkholderia gladioli]
MQLKELTSALPATLARGHATGRWFIDEMHQDLCTALAIAHDSQLRVGLNTVGAWEAGHQPPPVIRSADGRTLTRAQWRSVVRAQPAFRRRVDGLGDPR